MATTISAKKSLPLSVLNIWLGMCAYVLLSGFASGFTGLKVYPSLTWALVYWTVYYSLPWVLLAPVLRFGLSRFVQGSRKKSTTLLFAAVTFPVLALAHALLVRLLMLLALWWARDSLFDAAEAPWQQAGLLFFVDGFLLLDLVVFTVLLAGAQVRRLQEQLKAKAQDTLQLNRNLADSRLQTLKMQLNPHFLFNTLNGLAVLIDKNDNERARDMLGELSSFLRQTLRNPKEKWVTLDKELEFVKQYLSIEQYRFGKRLSYFEECEPLALSAKIPPMLLQPLFENAIVHGLANKQGECRLSFECRLYDRYLLILIFDNGENFDEARDPLHKGGIGLSNIQNRLREVYGDNYSITLEKKPDGTLVTLKLPAFKDSQF